MTLTGGRQIIQVPAGGGTRGRLLRTVGVAALLFFLLVVGYKLLHHQNRYEKLADAVTKAIAANNMAPVEQDFNAQYRPQLENRARVGALSDMVNALGTFQGAKEDPGSDASSGDHRFVAHFDKGQLYEDLKVDSEGKITSFHLHSQAAADHS
jgi:hypothetical protein